MPVPILNKYRLWSDSDKGLKTIRRANPPAVNREDIPDILKQSSLDTASNLPTRGEVAQEARLRRYPSIDVDKEQLFAGKIEGDINDARDKLFRLGYRNNPTAYVEVTEENGPDDGSYARQIITDESVSAGRNYITNFPTLFQRAKRQIHVCIWKVEDEVLFLAHEEKSAWLQPMLHLAIPDVSARIGVRDFRNDWYDEFGEELPGKDEVSWESQH